MLELKDIRLPEKAWTIGDPKEAVLDFLQALRLCKAKNRWEPLQDWIDAHNDDASYDKAGDDTQP